MYLGQVITDSFVVKNGSGQATNADTTPTVTVYRNGNGTAEPVTVANIGTGVYTYSFTIPNSWDIGDTISVQFSAAVGGDSVLSIQSLGTILYASNPSDNPTINFGLCIPDKTDFQNFLDLQGSFKYYERLAPKCLEAQRFDLRPVLGKDFYAEIIAVVENTDTILPESTFLQDSYNNLLPYLKNFVKYSAFVRYLKDANTILTRFGPKTKKTPHSDFSAEDKKESIRYYGSMARDYATELVEYLDDNANLFPGWGSETIVLRPGIGFSSS